MAKKQPIPRQVVFEARYDKGYRYLDRCGDSLLILEELLAKETRWTWLTLEAVPTGARMSCPDLDLSLVFNSERLIVDRNPIGDNQCDFNLISQVALATITGRFDLKIWKRFGFRRIKMIPADSIDEAESLSLRYAAKSLPDDRRPDKMGLREAQTMLRYETENRDKGVSLRVEPVHQTWAPLQPDPRLLTPAHLQPTQQREALIEQLRRAKEREKSPEAGLKLDIDYYWNLPAQDASPKAFLDEATKEVDSLEVSFMERRERQ